MASADGPQRQQEGLEAYIDRESRAPEVASPPQFISEPGHPWTPSQSRYQPEKASLIGESLVEHHESGTTNDFHAGKRSRICGLKRKSFIVVCVVVSIILVIAAVLGGVLPTQLGDRGASVSSNATPPTNQTQQLLSVQQQSGIAFISASDGVYAYYQDSDSNLVERKISENGTWQTTGDGVVAAAAAEGSPLAGSALWLGGTEYRALFFLDDSGQLLSTNRTVHQSWSTPISILATHATEPGTQALDVVVFPDDNWDLIARVYFGSVDQGIRELGIGGGGHFDDTEWNGNASLYVIPGSDSQSGLGVTSYNNLARQYLRNQTSGDLLQISFPWGSLSDQRGWRLTGNSSAANLPVATSSAITACSDGIGVGTDYVFYQTTNGSLVSALSLSGTSGESRLTETSGLSNFQVLDKAAPSSKLRALCDDTGAAALFYHGDDESALSWLQVKRNGEVVRRGFVNG